MLEAFTTNLVAVFLLLSALWIVSVKIRDASIIDPFWGFGFVVVAWLSWFCFGTPSSRALLVTILVSLWGLRLSGYLLWRNLGHEEDRRYAAMREKRGDSFWWKSLFIVFWLQALLLVVISVPVQFSVTSTASIGWLDVVGCLLFGTGLFFETVGDWQLSRFKNNPDNSDKILDSGLWGLTRHPNYFGDFCVWWGLFLFAAAAGGWWTIFSPILMSVLLMRVSGVTLLESDIAERRPKYREYIQTTNAFFPGWKRKFADSNNTTEA